MNGRDFNASLFAFGNNENEAVEYAKKQLREKVGNCAVTHSIAFIENDSNMSKTIRILEIFVKQMILTNQQKYDSNRASFITEVNEHIAELKEKI